jgi:hypothetical protein
MIYPLSIYNFKLWSLVSNKFHGVRHQALSCNATSGCSWSFFIIFNSKYPYAQVGYTKFHSLTTWQMCKLTTWNMCCCHYHQELKEHLVDFNDIKLDGKGIYHTYVCTCAQVCGTNVNLINVDKCNVHHVTYHGLTNLWITIICMKLV